MCSRTASILVVGVVVALLIFLSNGGARVDAAPFFGFSDFSGNGSSAVGLAALAHLQHKADSVAQLAELLALGENFTQSLFTK